MSYHPAEPAEESTLFAGARRESGWTVEHAGYPSGAAGRFALEQCADNFIDGLGPPAHLYSEHVADTRAVENRVPGSSNRIVTIAARAGTHARQGGP